MKSRGGFTLIEMLIVIAIIAILAGIVLSSVSSFQARARDTLRIGDLRNIQNYLELFFNKCGYYPGNVDASGNCTLGNTPTTWQDLQTLMTKTAAVTTQFPADPIPSHSFCYQSTNNGLGYVVGAILEQSNSVINNSVTTNGSMNIPGSDGAGGVCQCGPGSANNSYCVSS